MQSLFASIEDFNRRVVGIDRHKPSMLDDKESEWLVGVLREEIDEYLDAEDLTGKIDALIDLIYFAAGGLTRMGLSHSQSEAIFNIVHSANMQKAGGKKEGRAVEFELDAHKPDGWEGPEERIKKVLGI